MRERDRGRGRGREHGIETHRRMEVGAGRDRANPSLQVWS